MLDELCNQRLSELGFGKDEKYQRRLKWEIEEITAKEKSSYFLDLYNRKIRYPKNQNNLLVCYLLGIVNDFDINKDPNSVFTGDLPDIDIDYIPEVRDYLKNVWAQKTFGQEFVCNIGNYTTFGIKSALIDMARVHGESREEVLAFTKNLDAKDDEGKPLSWDAAMRLYPDLKKYCDDHPDIAEATKKLINRNRGMGVHAGGLIVANIPIHDLVPLVKRKDNPQASAWPEGLHGQDLMPVGLVKFDLLVISNLSQIARCCELIKQRHNIDGICNLPGQSDWTDIDKWRNDSVALEMANQGDLKCIFQFDSEGIRAMAKAGGVDRFEDLVAYTAIFRPGCLLKKMHERYIERKQGREQYSLHPLLQPYLGDTYGVMVYQEQIMQILNVVGNIPLKDCELVRKAISKKKVEAFIKYKEKFILEGQKNLNCSEKDINELWDLVLAFSEYGFNKTLTEDTIINTVNGSKQIKDIRSGDRVYCVNENGEQAETEVVAIHDHGVIDVVEVTFDDGYSVKCTLDHKFLTEEGQIPLWQIIQDNLVVLSSPLGERNAKEQKLGNNLRRDIKKQKKTCRTSQELHKMQGNLFAKENRKIQSQISLRKAISNKKQTNRTFEGMSRLYLFKMARDRNKACISMREGIFEIQFAGGTSPSLRKMHRNKKQEYSRSHGQVEQGQSCSRTQGNIFCNCEKNFSKEGYSGSKISTIKKMERQQSRRICEMHTKGTAFSQKIKNGDMAETASWMEAKENMLWRGKEICGFGKEKDLDRSGWAIPFLASGINIKQKRSQFKLCSIQRSNAQGGVFEKRGCDFIEIEHDLFSQQNRRNEEGMVGFTPDYAQITSTRNLVHRRVLRIVPVGKRQCYDLEVAVNTHNFILPNGVVTSNSHAVAYTYLSGQLLYLKAHYKHEFYTSILSYETLSDKIKEYKMEAKIHSVEVLPLDINKSKETFTLQGNDIYYGFSNVKGIGEEPAKKIVEGQPYKNFEDFLNRFGTDASVLKPLIGLRVFKDADPITLWKFVDAYKDSHKKNEDRKKRFEASLKNYDEEFIELTGLTDKSLADFTGDSPFDHDSYRKLLDKDESVEVIKEVPCDEDDKGSYGRFEMEDVEIDGVAIQQEILKHYKKIKTVKTYNAWKELKKLWIKRTKTIEKYNKKTDDAMPTLETFVPDEHRIDKAFAKELQDIVACEEKYYGFAWIHELEKSPDYRGNMTFNELKNQVDGSVGPVEIKIIKVHEKTSKKGSKFYQVVAEDATGQQGKINVWQDDMERWHEEFLQGNLLRLRLQPPSGGFPTFLLEGNSVANMRYKKRYVEKHNDPRVFLMRSGRKTQECMTDEEALDFFSNCVMN